MRGWIVGLIWAGELVLRQYLSGRSNLAAIDERELALIEKRLNDRPAASWDGRRPQSA